MSNATQEIIDIQFSSMQVHLRDLMGKVARRCANTWSEENSLNAVLRLWIQRIPYCRLLYALDEDGIQLSGNILANSVDETPTGQNLSGRPYVQNVRGQDFSLSEPYISKASRRSCLTAVHTVRQDQSIVGYIAADFELRDLPLLKTTSRQSSQSQRISGDPAISGSNSIRLVQSLVDRRIDDVNAIINGLVCDHGVFHVKLHYSTARMTLWLMDEPYHYRIHIMDELTDPGLCLAYARREYPTSAVVSRSDILPVLERCKLLRDRKNHDYLRAGSINIMNGLVGLNFSTDDTVYLSVSEFLKIPMDECNQGATRVGRVMAQNKSLVTSVSISHQNQS